MRTIKAIIILTILYSILCNDFNTKDPAFIKQFNVKHLKEGDGKNFPIKGSIVKIHHEDRLINNSRFYDSSVKREEPFSFMLGHGHSIKCWELVVSRMSKGEKVEVLCPANLAYGNEGINNMVPPNTDIISQIELLDYLNMHDEM